MRIFLSLILFLIVFSSYGQKEANYWYFGHRAGLDFSTSPPTAISGELDTYEGCSTISDSNGSLLFYSDGITVWNKNHQVMIYSNGTLANNLLGNPSSTQSALVIPKPGSNDLYYLFTINNSSDGLNYYTIDINKNSNLGQIIAGPIKLNGNNASTFGWTEKVTAVDGEACDTKWVISSDGTSFYAYKIDLSGVQTNGVESLAPNNFVSARGTLKVSPDGKKLVSANQSGNSYLFDFNTLTGEITNTITLNLSGESGYGAEFSPTSSKLFVSTGVHSQDETTQPDTDASIFQFDLKFTTSIDINNSKELINKEIGYRGALQLGVDGKIYYARSRKRSIGIISSPEDEGINVIYISGGIALIGTTTSSEGLPPFLQSFFSPIKILDSDTKTIDLTLGTHQVCIGDSFTFEPELSGLTGSTFKWTKIGDPSVNITTREITIGNTNFGSGSYNLEMEITDVCGRIKKYNGSVEILFVPKPIILTIPVYEQCDIDSNPIDGITEFNLQSKESILLSSTTGITVDFFETSDTNFSSPILNKIGYLNTISTNSGNHKLIVRATNDASGCQVFGEIELKANASALNSYPDLYLCEADLNANDPNATFSNGSANAYYNFDLKTNAIIANSGGAFSLTTHTFEYYRTTNDAALQTNQIVTPYEDDLFINNSDVFLRISIIGTNACVGIGEFKVFVNTLPTPQGNSIPVYLCVNNPIDNPQLITIDLNADTGVTTDTYQWYLNGNLITGATNAIHKASVQGTYRIEAYSAYQNDIIDTTDDSLCTGYNTFTVIESNKALIVSTDLTDNVDNSDENTLSIKTLGVGDYEYALNSTNTADFTKGTENLSFTFSDVKPGLNTVYIRDLNGCGIIASQKLSVLFFQRHFSPNNDGVLDTWRILGANNSFYTSARVEIFDRYGKVVALITDKDGQGWNGTYNGKKLPSNDYWFNAVLEDINGNIRKETGHFSLLRK